ncbi:MAG: GIY-YIG nuclease family protein [Calditrichia bacterium]
MYTVYIIRSKRTRRYYKGQTHDLDNRLNEDNSGKTQFTRSGIPWELIWSEVHETRSAAINRERQIKKRGIERFLRDTGVL